MGGSSNFLVLKFGQVIIFGSMKDVGIFLGKGFFLGIPKKTSDSFD